MSDTCRELLLRTGCRLLCLHRDFALGVDKDQTIAAHIGHGAIVHGANVGRNVLVGMNSVLMDEAEIGDDSIIGAMTFVPAKTIIPPRSLVVGNPGKVIKQVSDEMIAWKTKGTRLYQMLPKDCQDSLIACQPLHEVPENRPQQELLYETWNQIKKEQ